MTEVILATSDRAVVPVHALYDGDLAGFLEASRATFASPAHLGWHESGHVLMVVILGGIGTLFGPVIGAFALLIMEDQLKALTDRWLLIMGVFVIAVVMFLPNGFAGLLKRLERRDG